MDLLTHRITLVSAALLFLLLLVAAFPTGAAFMLANAVWTLLLGYLVVSVLKDEA
jgi:hypothetical protein